MCVGVGGGGGVDLESMLGRHTAALYMSVGVCFVRTYRKSIARISILHDI